MIRLNPKKKVGNHFNQHLLRVMGGFVVGLQGQSQQIPKEAQRATDGLAKRKINEDGRCVDLKGRDF